MDINLFDNPIELFKKIPEADTIIISKILIKEKIIMGYRSDVGLAIKEEFVNHFTQKCNEAVRLADEVIENDKGSLYVWTYIKWYDSYPEIQKVEDFLSGIGTENYYMVEIGEDYADIEHDGDWYDNPFDLGVDRQLSYNYHPNCNVVNSQASKIDASSLKKANQDGRSTCIECNKPLSEPFPGIRFCPCCES